MTPGIIIRPAVKSDAEDVLGLLADILELHRKHRPDLFRDGSSGKYDAESFSALLKDPVSDVFVADEYGRAIGYIIFRIESGGWNPVLRDIKTLYIDDLCVSEAHRGKGIGSALMKTAEDWARTSGCHSVTLNVWEFNDSARGLYSRLGYSTQRREMEKLL